MTHQVIINTMEQHSLKEPDDVEGNVVHVLK